MKSRPIVISTIITYIVIFFKSITFHSPCTSPTHIAQKMIFHTYINSGNGNENDGETHSI